VAGTGDGTLAVPQAPGGGDSQIWHLDAVDDTTYTLTNKATGKLLDVYARATDPGARVVQWQSNGGANQLWEFQ
ncbi:MAG: RICIN domain-containing protein, partial [Armatimonadetes bacterium]|nr:RICIN domain-containing protein [Armatimonadota bacterium]